MRRHSGIPGIAVLAALAATAAGASDLDIIDAPEIVLTETVAAQSWYIRGDLGYAGWMKGERPSYTVRQPGGAVFSRETFDTGRFSEPVSYGVGVGYQFSPLFRADITTDFFNGRMTGSSDVALPCSGAEAAGTGCGFDHRARYRAANVMANGYLDLGTVMGFTPYVGAGVGATNLRWGDLTTTPHCLDGAAACSGMGHAVRTASGNDSWRFTYSLMAGASYDVSDRLKLDFGYRFTDVDGGRAFGYGPDGAGWSASGRDGGFKKHEIRAGLRFSIW